MKKIVTLFVGALVLGTMIFGVVACKKKEGPLERAGKAIDNAGDKAVKQFDKAKDAVKDATK